MSNGVPLIRILIKIIIPSFVIFNLSLSFARPGALKDFTINADRVNVEKEHT